MKREYTSVRGIIATEPKIVKDYLSRKRKVLFFTVIHYSTDSEGKRWQHKHNIVVKEYKCRSNKYDLELLKFFTETARKGDIVRLYGYYQHIRVYKSKPFLCLRVIAFRYLWSNKQLEKEKNEAIYSYDLVYHPSRHKEQVEKIKSEMTKNPKNVASCFLGAMLGKETKYKNQKEKYKSLLDMMAMNKSLAIKTYNEGNKYKAIAKIILNRYIWATDIPSHARKDLYYNHHELLECDFKTNGTIKPIRDNA